MHPVNPTGLSNTRKGWKVHETKFADSQISGTFKPRFETFKGGIGAYLFEPKKHIPTEKIESLHAQVLVPSDYNPGSTIFPHFDWVPTTDAAGDVVWMIEWIIANGFNEEVYDETSEFAMVGGAHGEAYAHQCIDLDQGIQQPFLDIDDFVMIRLYRNITHPADTYPDAAFALSLHWWYETVQRAHKQPRPDYRRDIFKQDVVVKKE